MSAITLGEDLVHYEKLGRGRPVILIHGWLGSWRYWIPLMQQLHLKYSVYTLDLPGFGDSTKNRNRYTLTRMVDTLYEFMDKLSIPKAAFLGHGLGAMVLVEFALHNPDKVARMLLSSLPLFDPGDLEDRVPAGIQVQLTNNQVRPDAPTIVSGGADNDITDATLARRPANSYHEAPTIVRPVDNINRERLLERAREMQIGRPNPLLDIFNERNKGQLLDKCFKRNEPVYDKLKADVDRTDDLVMKDTAVGFDAGTMLDNMRRASSLTPLVVVHGNDDPLMPAPTEDILNYLTIGKEEVLVPITIPGVRHFPMLEHEPFPRLAGDFLEAADIAKLEIRERWRRRSR